ncbi:MAG: BrnT family toxin [Kiritimatiellae bacterium]|nr:BrnT family toxin [Kiritimatiellia bacterium]MCO5068718.1 BrnT family toxin [Kiritimatiellia bacterium]
MVKPSDRLRACTGFVWDEGNATKNWDSHDVSQAECEETFFNQPLIVQRDKTHSLSEIRYFVLGRTDSGRRLFIAFTIRSDKVRVISARDMTPSEHQRYPR